MCLRLADGIELRTLSYFLVAIACVVALAAGTKTASAQASSQIGCHEIAIVGAVKTPGRFDLQTRMRLIEILKRAGGPSERAGQVVRVIHFCKCAPCSEGAAKAPAANEYNLADVLRGNADANPYIAAGDLVTVPEAELIFMVGNVLSQKRLVFREGVTLTRAIAMVGGAASYGDLVRVRIHRSPAAGPRPKPLIFTLKAVRDNRNEDPVLQPQDILEISDESGNFRSPLRPPIFLDPPLIRPTDPPLIARTSSNC